MIKIKLHKNGRINEVTAGKGDNLLKVIQSFVNGFYAPCGGNGTCGKCRVRIVDEGVVTSCLYEVEKDIEVILPDDQEMKVLSSQYNFSEDVVLNPGDAALLADSPVGVAVDIGTTTIVYYFVDLKSGGITDIVSNVNPQVKYGADVISRINYTAENDSGTDEMKYILIDNFNRVTSEFCRKHGYKKEDVARVSIAGNTVMLHMFLGVNALSIAHAPFTPVFTETRKLKPQEAGLDINKNATVILTPSLSGYVGGDIIAGLASVKKDFYKKQFLFVDIGTNGEIVLVTKDRMLACATAAGPAFEGANISCGMSAVTGAVSSFRNGSPGVIGDAEAAGVCGSGLIDIIAFMLDNGTLSMEGNIESDFTIPGTDIKITQQDVREVQLAKSAIAAGINRLLSIAGISVNELDNILLAGGFGNYIDIRSAIRIGLLPDVDTGKYIQMGNTAGNGAVLALKSDDFIPEMENLKKKIEYIELSTDPEFSMEYAMNMFFA
ncbi:MAG: DUF4445 domain-containing protein [Chlorobi bacterium]|nr:DUF4445 domain-containing protein [Chlorobiota bacterium]